MLSAAYIVESSVTNCVLSMVRLGVGGGGKNQNSVGTAVLLKGFADSRPFELLLSEVTGTYHSAFSNLKQLNIFYKFTPHCTVFVWGVTPSFLYYILTWICMIHVKQTAFASYDLGQLVTPEVYPQKKAI